MTGSCLYVHFIFKSVNVQHLCYFRTPTWRLLSVVFDNSVSLYSLYMLLFLFHLNPSLVYYLMFVCQYPFLEKNASLSSFKANITASHLPPYPIPYLIFSFLSFLSFFFNISRYCLNCSWDCSMITHIVYQRSHRNFLLIICSFFFIFPRYFMF